jgi:hypothetical protein
MQISTGTAEKVHVNLAAYDPDLVFRSKPRLTLAANRKTRDSNYVDELEAQLDVLRQEVKRLEDLRLADLSDVFADNGHVHDAQTIEGLKQSMAHQSADHKNELTALSDISSLMWQLKIGEARETSFVGPSGNSCFPVSNRRSPRDIAIYNTEDAEPNTRLPDLAWGPWTVEARLLEIFAHHINPVYQFVDRETLAAVVIGSASIPNHLKLAMISAAALLSDDPGSELYGNHLASLLEATALRTCRQNPDVSTVQALSILCW